MNSPDENQIQDALFDPDLIAHMDRCWQAHCENAERLNKKVGIVVSTLALLFGLGLFKIDWTTDPKQVLSIHPGWLIWPIKLLLSLALLCFVRGLYLGLRGVRKRGGPRAAACDLLPFPQEIVKSPPPTDRETRAQVFYRLDKAVTELATQNSEKSDRVVACEKWFLWGMALVLIVLLTLHLD